MSDASNPDISIVIPARNEEIFLPRCLASIKQAFETLTRVSSAKLEIVVVLNRCTDRTEQIAREHGCHIVCEDAKNLARIRNAGVYESRGKHIVTVDADSLMSEGTLIEIQRQLSNPNMIGGGFLMLPDRWSFGILATTLFLLPYALFERLSGGLFWFRRSDFETLGGFDERYASVEDLDFARRLKRLALSRGQKFRMIWRSHIITSTRKFDHFGDWYFFMRPRETLRMLRGFDQELANKVWYDFKR